MSKAKDILKNNRPLILIFSGLLVFSGLYYFFNRETPAQVPPAPASLETYADKTHGFSFAYPKGFILAKGGGSLSDTLVSVALPDSSYKCTNLIGASFNVGLGPSLLGQCLDLQAGEQAAGEKEIGGTAFRVFYRTGVALGNIYEAISYRTARRGTCFEIVLMLHSGNILKYGSGTVQFNKPLVLDQLDRILASFKFEK